MVRATLDDRKTETRRTVGLKKFNVNPDEWHLYKSGDGTFCWQRVDDIEACGAVKCPYGVKGDRLWVRETWFDCEPYKSFPLFEGKSRYLYKADGVFIGDHAWKPSIHILKENARIWLEVLDVDIERLHSIKEQAAIAEGVERVGSGFKAYAIIHQGRHKGTAHPFNEVPNINARMSYEELWESINGENSWSLNPWVWVVKYKVLSKTGKP